MTARDQHGRECGAHAALRAATASDHAATDAAFARFDLADRDSYADFLAAHARVLPAVERAVHDVAGVPGILSRASALAADLAALGRASPPPDAVDAPASAAAAWGMLYVIEGSRLGGGMLARRVGTGLPHAYLDSVHPPGGWRRFCQALDAAAAPGGDLWLAQAIPAARAVFARYAAAARG